MSKGTGRCRGAPPRCIFPADRRALATIFIIFVLIVLSIGAFAFFTTLQQRRFQQYKQLHGEIAYGLAQVALEVARTHLAASVRAPDSPLYEALTSPTETWRADASGRVALETLDVLADYRALVADVMSTHEHGVDLVSRLAVTFAVRPEQTKPFEDVKAGAVALRSTREKQGTLLVEATCAVAGGLLAETEQKLTGLVEFRVVAPALPVLSDFTLFLAEPPRGGDSKRLNVREADHRGVPSDGKSVLVLANGDARPRREWAALDLDTLARQGWVYVGGEEKLVLNLTFATREDDLGAATAGSVGEDFHFFHGDPARPKAMRAYADRLANQRIGNDPSWEVRYWDMGCPDAFAGGYLPQVAPAFTAYDHHDLHASLLHLYGKPGAVSPTLVFGKVETGFLRLSAAAGKGGSSARVMFCLLKSIPPDGTLEGMHAELSVLIPPGQTAVPESALASEAGQSKSGKLVYLNRDRTLRAPENPRLNADAYREIQSKLATRPYNGSLPFLATQNREPFPLDRGATFTLPRALFTGELPDPPVPAREGPHTVPAAAWPQELRRGELDLRQLAGAMGDVRLTMGRASRRLPRPAGTTAVEALARAGHLEGDRLELGGIVENPGSVTLPAGLRVTRGGALLADEIVIEGDLTAGPDDPVLLVALRGGVRVERAGKVAAALAAPQGTVSVAGETEVAGQVVARALDLDRVDAAPRPTFLRYDPGLKGGADGQAGRRRFQIDVSRTFVQVR